MMDELNSPAMLQYRVKEIFNFVPSYPDESSRNGEQALVIRRQRQRWKVSVDRMCQRHDNQGKAFVKNHLRDVVYEGDLLKAIAISLNLNDLVRHENRFVRVRKSGAMNSRFKRNLKRRKRILRSRKRSRIRSRKRREALMNYLEVLLHLFPHLEDKEMEESYRTYIKFLFHFTQR